MSDSNNLYYTPLIEDLFIGYECEGRGHSFVEGGIWMPFRIQERMKISSEYLKDVRTLYLTKEQIEAEGWEYIGRATDIWFKKEGSFHSCSGGYKFSEYKIHYGLHDHVLFVEAFFGGESEGKLYEGFCPSINEFRKICKLLNIK